jgi:hypothetical protein
VLTIVKVAVAPDTIVVGASATASAIGLDQNSATIGIVAPVWSTTSPSVATVSASGIVTAIAPGQTTLVASVNGKQGERTLTIVLAAVARVVITPVTGRVARGATLQISAITLDYTGHDLSGRAIDFSSSDATKATVAPNGLVTGVAAGTVTILATSEKVTTSMPLTVTAVPDSVATVTVSPAVKSLTVGGSVQLAATLRDSTGKVLTGRTVEWSVSGIPGFNAATVSSTGLVTAVAPGTVVVEAFAEGQHGSVTIIVGDNLDENIVVSFAAPVENALVGDTLLIVVGVKSERALADVSATVGPLRVTLKLTQVGAMGGGVAWVGTLDVTELPTGPYQILTTATDVTGARGVGSRQFQRNTRSGKGGSGDVPRQK